MSHSARRWHDERWIRKTPTAPSWDGYLAGRYTERLENRAATEGVTRTGGPDRARSYAGEGDDDVAAGDEASYAASEGDSWSDGFAEPLHRPYEVWADPDETFAARPLRPAWTALSARRVNLRPLSLDPPSRFLELGEGVVREGIAGRS